MANPNLIWQGPTTQLVETVDSPQHTYGQTISIIRSYHGLHSLCVSSALYKGTLGTGDMTGYIVDSSAVTRMRGGAGKLVITWFSNGGTLISNQQTPADEYGIEPFEINPSVLKNPRFLNADGTPKLTQAELDTIGQLRGVQSADGQATLRNGLTSQLSKDAFNAISRGAENFYLSGFRYSWTRYFWSVAGTVSRGGFIEAPSGPLTGLLPAGISWLREADTVDFTGQYFKYRKSWLGGPNGHWDPVLYS